MSLEKTLPLAPIRLSRYQILREIGRGTMGIVYEAFDPNLERTVALKTVHLQTDNAQNREFEERFQREAKSAGRINHPNIVTIHDAGKEGDTAFIAMEFLEGRSLREIIDSGVRPTLEETLSFAAQIAEGLDYAHKSGIIHRDIKPANIVVTGNGRVKITDFGIAQLPSGDLTQTGTLLGTPKYMSPEQLRGERLDGRSDIFSLGIILYELLTGQPPFNGDSLATIMYKILHEPPEDPLARNPQCPTGLCLILARCLAKDKELRYKEAGEIVQDLRNYEQLSDNGLRAATFRQVSRPQGNLDSTLIIEKPAEIHAGTAKRRRWPWIAAAAALVLTGLALAFWFFSSNKPEPPAKVLPPEKTLARPQRKPTTETTVHSTTTTSQAEKPAAPKRAATAKPKPGNPAEAKPRKGFWRRQIDCIKHGICDRPAGGTQPDRPPTP